MARPGPKGERFDDGPYLLRMAVLMQQERIKAWPAAQRVVDNALPGNSNDAKAKRLHSKFLAKHGGRPIDATVLLLQMRELGRAFQGVVPAIQGAVETARRSGVLNYLQTDHQGRNYLQKRRTAANKLQNSKIGQD